MLNTPNYNTLLDQCIQSASDSFTNEEIHELYVTIQNDIWSNGFFKYHPIQSVTSNNTSIQQLCESIMANTKDRAEKLEDIIQQLHNMTDIEYTHTVVDLSYSDHPYEDYHREKQSHVIHDEV